MQQCEFLHGSESAPNDFDRPLKCGNCGATIPASSALTFEGADYVREFCGEGCLSDWCAGVAEVRRPRERQ